jgi:hypothetical protein
MPNLKPTHNFRNLTDGSKLALFTQTHEMNYIFRLGLQKFAILKEKIISDYHGIMMPMNTFIFKVLNEKVVQLVESGIMGKLLQNEKPKEQLENEKVPLSLEHLDVWFVIWAGLLTLALAVFIGEIVAKKIQNAVQRGST